MKCPRCGCECRLVYAGQDDYQYDINEWFCFDCGWTEGEECEDENTNNLSED